MGQPPRGKRRPLDPADVLEGRVRFDSDELIGLIHAINPSGEGLRAQEAASRYALKARLQSLLIERFAEDLEVELTPEDPDVVSLRHRVTGRDACHAVTDQLDEAARSWVRRQLDERAVAAAAEARSPKTRARGGRSARAGSVPGTDDPRAGADAATLLGEGRRALESYDFEGAERCFVQALERSVGGAEAARLLLELLVGQLGADQEALARETALSEAARADPEVRVRLALAAARTGDAGAAERWLEGTEHPDVPEVLAVLGERALRARDEARAIAYRDLGRLRAPRHPATLRLAGGVDAFRAGERASDEEALRAALTAGKRDEASSLAERILERWPESGEARRALAAIEAGRRAAEIAGLVAEAEACTGRGDPERAARLLREALARGGDRALLAPKIEAAEAAARGLAEEKAVAQTLEAVGRADLSSALAGYADLSDEGRAAVRRRLAGPPFARESGPGEAPAPDVVARLLDRLDRLRLSPPAQLRGKRAPRAAADAVLALGAAEEAVDRGDLDQARAVIAPHDGILRGLPERGALLERIALLEEARKQAIARAVLDAARRADGDGDPAAAVRALEAADLTTLDQAERDEADALRARARDALARNARLEALDRLIEAGRFFEARALLRAEFQREGGAREGLSARAEQVEASIRAAFGVRVLDDLDPELVLPDVEWIHYENPEAWLTADAREVVLATGHREWVVVRRLEVDTGRVRRAFVVCPAEPFEVGQAVVDGAELVLVSSTAAVLRLSLTDGSVLEWAPSPAGQAGIALERSFIVPGTRFLWTEGSPRRASNFWTIGEIGRRPQRELDVDRLPIPVPGLAEPWVLVYSDDDDDAQLRSARGAPSVRLRPLGYTLGVAADIREQSLLRLLTDDPDAEDPEVWLESEPLDGGAGRGAITPIALLDPAAESAVATSSAHQLCFVIGHFGELGRQIVAYRPREGREGRAGRFEEIWRVAAPEPTIIVQDIRARRTFALMPGGRVAIAELGAEPPLLRGQDRPPRRSPFLQGHSCGTVVKADVEDHEVLDVLRDKPVPAQVEWLRQHVEALEARGAVSEALRLLRSPRISFALYDAKSALEAGLHERHPNIPDVALRRAAAFARADDWASVRATLEPVADQLDKTYSPQHFAHLLGLARMWAGDLVSARRVLEIGLLREGDCPIESVFELLSALERRSGLGPDAGEGIRDLIQRLDAADARLAAGDTEGALEQVDVPAVWHGRDIQFHARLAQAYLLQRPASPSGEVRKLLALSRYLEVHLKLDRPAWFPSLPLPGRTWDRPCLDAIALAARAWLEDWTGRRAAGPAAQARAEQKPAASAGARPAEGTEGPEKPVRGSESFERPGPEDEAVAERPEPLVALAPKAPFSAPGVAEEVGPRAAGRAPRTRRRGTRREPPAPAPRPGPEAPEPRRTLDALDRFLDEEDGRARHAEDLRLWWRIRCDGAGRMSVRLSVGLHPAARDQHPRPRPSAPSPESTRATDPTEALDAAALERSPDQTTAPGEGRRRRLPFEALLRAPELCMISEDRRALEVLALGWNRGAEHGSEVTRGEALVAPVVHRLILALVGHPRVEWMPSRATPPASPGGALSWPGGHEQDEDSPEGGPSVAPRRAIPVEVCRGHLELAVVEPEPGVLRLDVAIDGQPRPWSEVAQAIAAGLPGGIMVDVDEAARRVRVSEVPPAVQRLLEALGSTKAPAVFGPEHQDALLERLARLEGRVPLTWRASLKGERVDPDVRPFLRIEAFGEGVVELALRVRPLVGGPSFPPGRGPSEVVGRRPDATLVHTVRDLMAESDAAIAIARGLRPLVAAGPDALEPDEVPEPPFESALAGESAIACIAELERRAAAGWDVPIEWASTPWRVLGPKARGLRIMLEERGDWFGVSGALCFGETRIKLALLLDAARRERRFVRIGRCEWAEVGDALRKVLVRLDDVLVERGGALRAGPEAAHVIALLEREGAFDLEAPSSWRGLLQRIERAEKLTPALPAGFAGELRGYQRDGYEWLMRRAAWGAGACLADDMGLGKTVQTLAVLLERASRGPALVLAPASVGFNWAREAARFAPGLRVTLLRDLDLTERAASISALGPGDLLVSSYELATRAADLLEGKRFATLVLDEAQSIKNPRTRRARAVHRLDAEWRVALTGTPVENRLADLWSLFRALSPRLLGPWSRFRDRFAAPIERGEDPSRMEALSRVLAPFVLRRKKAEVTPELPPRTEVEALVLLSAQERQLYEDARLAAVAHLRGLAKDMLSPEQHRFSVLAAITRLREAACHPRLVDPASTVPSAKEKRLVSLVSELRAEGHRALVFSHWTRHLAFARKALEEAGASVLGLDGSTPAPERARLVDAFQEGGADVFLLSLKAGGTGLNLTAADHVIHLEPWWNPAVEDQAADRAHRIGQERPVTICRLIAHGTIEEAMLSLHSHKRSLLVDFLEGARTAAEVSVEELVALIDATALPAAKDEDMAGEDGERDA